MKRHTIWLAALLTLTMSAAAQADLQTGDTGDDVQALQQMLFDTGWLSEEPDGVYGEMTAIAVRDFQEYAGMEGTGIADDSLVTYLAKEAGKETGAAQDADGGNASEETAEAAQTAENAAEEAEDGEALETVLEEETEDGGAAEAAAEPGSGSAEKPWVSVAVDVAGDNNADKAPERCMIVLEDGNLRRIYCEEHRKLLGQDTMLEGDAASVRDLNSLWEQAIDKLYEELKEAAQSEDEKKDVDYAMEVWKEYIQQQRTTLGEIWPEDPKGVEEQILLMLKEQTASLCAQRSLKAGGNTAGEAAAEPESSKAAEAAAAEPESSQAAEAAAAEPESSKTAETAAAEPESSQAAETPAAEPESSQAAETPAAEPENNTAAEAVPAEPGIGVLSNEALAEQDSAGV